MPSECHSYSGMMKGISSKIVSSSVGGSSRTGAPSGVGLEATFGGVAREGFGVVVGADFGLDSLSTFGSVSGSVPNNFALPLRRDQRLKSFLSMCSRTCSSCGNGLMLSGSSLPRPLGLECAQLPGCVRSSRRLANPCCWLSSIFFAPLRFCYTTRLLLSEQTALPDGSAHLPASGGVRRHPNPP
jgi:hypothetical protein